MREQPFFVNCCHCRQCQKVTGTAFALNGMIEAEFLEITHGEERLETRAGESRCSECTTLLWSEHRRFGHGIKFVRIGTLDQNERITPDAHFFVRTKHAWIVIPPGVRQFAALPGENDPPLMSKAAQARLEAARRP